MGLRYRVVRRGASALIAATLIILASILISVILYAFMSGYVGVRVGGGATSPNLLVIEAVLPHGRPRPYGLDLILANHDARPATLGNASALIISGSGIAYKAVLVLTEYPLTIPAGGVGKVILYPLEDVPPGKYYVKLMSSGGGEAIAPAVLRSEVLGSRVVVLGTGNDQANKVIAEDGRCRYEAWVEYDAANQLYYVWFNFSPKPGVTLRFWRAELLNAENSYPVWVWGNPYNNTLSGLTALTYPNYDAEYWYPVSPSEFPVKVVFTSSP